MVLLLIVVISAFYYETQKKLMLSNQRATMAKYAYIQTKRLKVLHHFFDEQRTYPRDPRFKSAIYDIEYKKIFSLLDDPDVRFNEEIYLTGNHIHLVKMLDEFYLGTRYLIIEIEDDGIWRQEIWSHILGYGLLAFFLFMLFGLFLARMFVRPMKDSIMLLDRFIKDTTHELNTPLSAILANIEMMDTDVMVEKNRKKLNRINIAAKTVSTLYKDLTYLTLEQEKEEHKEKIDLKTLILDRAEYFSVLAESKKLNCALDLKDAEIYADRRKITRVIDNLISNAIKYNKRGGTVGITLREGYLEIWDTGIGIEKEKIPFMFDRYMRFNESEGGFGIGLSIVKMILDEYDIDVKVLSQKGEGTRIILKWSHL
jgi:two-component system OmpR family sensor kinase